MLAYARISLTTPTPAARATALEARVRVMEGEKQELQYSIQRLTEEIEDLRWAGQLGVAGAVKARRAG